MTRRDPAQRGFTMVEMAVTVAVIAVTLALAMPSLNKMIPRIKLRGAANQLANDLQLARLKCISGNYKTRIAFDTANHNYTRYLDTNRDGAFAAGEADLSNRTLSSGIVFVPGSTAPNVTFDPIGSADDGTGNLGLIPVTLANQLTPPDSRQITVHRTMGVIKIN